LQALEAIRAAHITGAGVATAVDVRLSAVLFDVVALDEIASCEPFLIAQLKAIKPKLICALGGIAVSALLKAKTPLSKLRGRFHDYYGIPLLVTYHPAYLLRNPNEKKTAWQDLQLLQRDYTRLTGRPLR